MAYYVLTFNMTDEDMTWSTNKTRIMSTIQPVKVEISPESLELERNYKVTVTIITLLGNVSSSQKFSKYNEQSRGNGVNYSPSHHSQTHAPVLEEVCYPVYTYFL